MSDSVFGSGALTGYTDDPDLDPITVGTVFYLRSDADDGWTTVGVRIFPMASGANLTGAYAYLYGTQPDALLAVKAFPSPLTPGEWNEVLFTLPVSTGHYPAMYVAAVYLPNGGYVSKTGVFTSFVQSSNHDLIGTDAGDAFSHSIPGNGVVQTGTIANPASPPADPAWAAFSDSHYGVDVLVQDPADAPPSAPLNAIAPVVSGTPTTGHTLTCSTGTWLGTLPITYSYQWKRDATNVGTDSAGYTLTSDDEGASITCVVTATNGIGEGDATSNALDATEAPAPSGQNARLHVRIDDGWTELTFGAAGEPGFRPEDYGALRNDFDDDTAAINDCIAAAVEAAISDGTYVATVRFSPGVYKLSSPTTVGGAGQGNAQIPLPVLAPEDSQKLTLRLLGTNTASCLHWAQEESLKVGTVLRTTLEDQGVDGTYGFPSVIGGPATQVGDNPLAPYFSNVHVVIDGVVVMAPPNPSLMAFDLRGMAQATVRNSAATVDATAPDLNESPPTNDQGYGLFMPSPGNNAVADCSEFTAQGYFVGVAFAEHFVSDRLLILHCNTGMFYIGSRQASTGHTSVIQYACVEACQTAIDSFGAGPFALTIVELDLELIGDTQNHIIDTNNYLYGEIGWNDYLSVQPKVSGGRNLRIIDRKTARGSFDLTLPASTAAGTVKWRDRRIHIGGGTLTAVVVDGKTLPDVPRAFEVPSGRPWSITYTGSPTAVEVVQ